MINRFVVAAISLVLLVAARATCGDDAKGVAKKMEGTWTIESATKDGKELAALKGGQVVIAGNKMTTLAKGKDKGFAMTFELDPSKKPGTIDFTVVDAPPMSGSPPKGIYELDKDNLMLCHGGNRPMEFSDKGAMFLVLKRKK